MNNDKEIPQITSPVSTVAEDAVDQLQANEKLIAGQLVQNICYCNLSSLKGDTPLGSNWRGTESFKLQYTTNKLTVNVHNQSPIGTINVIYRKIIIPDLGVIYQPVRCNL